MLSHRCRLCAKTKNNLRPVYDEAKVFLLSEMAYEILSNQRIIISADDPLSSCICPQCFQKLQRCCQFIQKCQIAQTVLQKFMKNDSFFGAGQEFRSAEACGKHNEEVTDEGDDDSDSEDTTMFAEKMDVNQAHSDRNSPDSERCGDNPENNEGAAKAVNGSDFRIDEVFVKTEPSESYFLPELPDSPEDCEQERNVVENIRPQTVKVELTYRELFGALKIKKGRNVAYTTSVVFLYNYALNKVSNMGVHDVDCDAFAKCLSPKISNYYTDLIRKWRAAGQNPLRFTKQHARWLGTKITTYLICNPSKRRHHSDRKAATARGVRRSTRLNVGPSTFIKNNGNVDHSFDVDIPCKCKEN